MKKKRTHKKKSSGVSVVSNLSIQPLQVVERLYTRKELDPTIQLQLSEHPEEFKILITRLNVYTPTNLPQELKQAALKAIIEYIKMLNLLNSDEKLKNFQDAYFNSEYFKISYSFKIALLYFHLNMKNKMYPVLHQSLMEYNHPTLIKAYLIIINKNVVNSESEINFMYLMKLIQSNIESFGNRIQKQEIDTCFGTLGFDNRKTGLIQLARKVFEFYYLKKDSQNIEALLSILYTSTATDLLQEAQSILQVYLRFYLGKSEFQEANRVLSLFEKFAVGEHYYLATKYMMNTGKQKHVNLSKSLSEKGAALGDIRCMANFAAFLVYDNEDIPRALQLIKEIQKKISKAKVTDAECNAIHGRCFQLLGRIYDFGLLPPVYSQNHQQAFDYYSKAAQYNDINATQDLGIMYKDGQGIAQDLEKAGHLLSKIDNPDALKELAKVRLMQAATASKKDRAALIQNGIEKINQALNQDADNSCAHLVAAMLLLAHDIGINVVIDDNQQTLSAFYLDALFKDYENANHLNVESVKAHLITAAEKGAFIAFYTLGCLFHSGNYFEEDLNLAEFYYKRLYESNSGIPPLELVNLYLLQNIRANNDNDKQKSLSQAVSWHRRCLESVYNIEDKIYLEKKFSKLLRIYSSKETYEQNPKKWFSIYKLRERTLLSSSEKTVDIQLKEAIHSTQTYLDTSENQPIDFESGLMKSIFRVALILKKSQMQIPTYSNQLINLNELQQTLQKQFSNFSVNTQIELLKCCSQWPLLNQKNGSLDTLLMLSQPDNLNLSEKASLALALIHTRHPDGLFEDYLIRLFYKISAHEINHISTAARLIYIFAITLANGTDVSSSVFIRNTISTYLSPLLNFICDHCSEANSDDKSQIYHGMNYLRLVYPEHFKRLPDNLLNFVRSTFQFLINNDTVTISHQQQQVYNELRKLDSNFEHEVLVGGRQVDFYNPKTRQIIFYNGPSHFLFSSEGIPCSLNPATVLSAKTLELQGYIVTHISYSQWKEVASAKSYFLKQQILPFNKPVLIEEEMNTLERNISPVISVQSPYSFWQQFTFVSKEIDSTPSLEPRKP